MIIELKLFGTFREGRFKRKDLELAEGTQLSAIVEPLDLPESQAKIVMVKGIAVMDDCVLHDKDVIAIFPMIAGG